MRVKGNKKSLGLKMAGLTEGTVKRSPDIP